MSLIEALPLTAILVEVSGWDEDELLFVEKSAMSTDDFESSYISLRHHLSDGAIVFVRTIQSAYLHRPNPIPSRSSPLAMMRMVSSNFV
jgi:hypothetical protein